MKRRTTGSLVTLLATTAMLATTATVDAQSKDIPRTADGKPDLQGNWSNATLTPVQRPPGMPKVLTPEQVATMEGDREAYVKEDYEDSDPDRGAPAKGGEYTGNALFDAASGGTGGYNQFYIDGGDLIAVYNGEPRSSLVTFPENGIIPAFSEGGQRRMREAMARAAQFDEFDNPENRPLAERCIMSFGSNAGPPMLPNYFYNNNYTIVQTPDHIMIMTEMVHDTRIIPILDGPPPASEFEVWMGISWARWEGDVLVIETTNIREEQRRAAAYVFPGGSENMKVTERLTRADEYTLNYEFMVDDPDMYSGTWGGEVPFRALGDRLYEYACHEANYALFNVLSGARAQEREAGGNDPGQEPRER